MNETAHFHEKNRVTQARRNAELRGGPDSRLPSVKKAQKGSANYEDMRDWPAEVERRVAQSTLKMSRGLWTFSGSTIVRAGAEPD